MLSLEVAAIMYLSRLGGRYIHTGRSWAHVMLIACTAILQTLLQSWERAVLQAEPKTLSATELDLRLPCIVFPRPWRLQCCEVMLLFDPATTKNTHTKYS